MQEYALRYLPHRSRLWNRSPSAWLARRMEIVNHLEQAMPSPFPGMDPYLEDRAWEDFHLTFNTVMRELLQPDVRPRYIVSVQQRVYVEYGLDEAEQIRWPDVAVMWPGGTDKIASPSQSVGSAVAPVECIIPAPLERREAFLVVHEAKTMEVVTVIETLSPANKRAGSDGRRQYLKKRAEVLSSETNLVEIDLLRGGQRLPVLNCPAGDYYAIVSRGSHRPRADVYAWTMRQSIPEIKVPLRPDDPEVQLALQQVFAMVYDRADYVLRLDYSAGLSIPLTEEDEAWRKGIIAAQN